MNVERKGQEISNGGKRAERVFNSRGTHCDGKIENDIEEKLKAEDEKKASLRLCVQKLRGGE